jgi:hypothetical protein
VPNVEGGVDGDGGRPRTPYLVTSPGSGRGPIGAPDASSIAARVLLGRCGGHTGAIEVWQPQVLADVEEEKA